MIQKVGLLNRGLESLVDGAWSIYSGWEYAFQPSQPDYTTTLIDEFKKTFSRKTSPSVELLGLFDCVNSVGLLIDRLFPFSSKLTLVKQIRHAVSIDERRGKYKQNLVFPNHYSYSWFPSSVITTPSALSRKVSSQNSASDISSKLHEARKLIRDIEGRLVTVAGNRRRNSDDSSLGKAASTIDKGKILSGEFQELWFSGNHGDVGGGWNPDVNGQFLSNVPLRWMIAEAIVYGVEFDKKRVVEFSERYSSIDSFLSCSHDVLSFCSSGLTHSTSSVEQAKVIQLSKNSSDKKISPYFRSCDIPKTKSLKALYNNGISSISMKRINFDVHDPFSKLNIPDIFSYHKSLPKEKIRGYDGHGNNSIWAVIAWWLIEFLPLGTKIESLNNKWTTQYKPNLGRARVMPAFAKVHWSVYWRIKYCYDYKPTNLPEYIYVILNDYSLTNEDDNIDDIILKRAIEEAKQQVKQWEQEKWQIAPDDLTLVLEKFKYIDPESSTESNCPSASGSS